MLLTGPPGTGKTLLARALAGEAEVPFFSISASEFVEMFVGVGASRVRDLFAEAKKAAPAIIFIDELDAIGRARGPAAGMSGGHDEREQTLNQILTELDGFDPSIGVIVLSATNRPEVIDPALLRPGRFDRRVALQPPDTAGRRKILAVHTRSVPLADDADLDRLAATTPGMVGADLANVVNEAALLAASRTHEAVSMADFEDALEKLILGTERRILLSPEERRRTAYHEAGHTIVVDAHAWRGPGAQGVDHPARRGARRDPVRPRGRSLQLRPPLPPGQDQGRPRRPRGRGAGLRRGDHRRPGRHQGADAARPQHGRALGDERRGRPAGGHPREGQAPMLATGEVSPETTKAVDDEVRRMVLEELDEVRELLTEHRDELDLLADALLQHETLDTDEAYEAVGLQRPPKPAVLSDEPALLGGEPAVRRLARPSSRISVR